MRRAVICILGAVLALSVVLVDPRSYWPFRLPKQLASGYGLTLIAALLLAGGLSDRRALPPRRKLWAPLALLALWALGSILWSVSRPLSVAQDVFLLLGALGTAAAAASVRSMREVRGILAALVVPATLTAG